MKIDIQDAREHNLKDVTVSFGDGLTVVTGVSGSGKTSLVFDTLYHEARRRFLEIFSLGSTALRLAPAKVGSITGLGPAVAVGQNLLNRNPSSTLATASGLHPFFRLLFANFSQRRCAVCSAELEVFSQDEVIEQLQYLAGQSAISLLAPLVDRTKGSHATLLGLLNQQSDAQSIWVDNKLCQPSGGVPSLDAQAPHDIQVELARFSGEQSAGTLRGYIEQLGQMGLYSLVVRGAFGEKRFPLAPVCPGCGTWFTDLRPTHFLIPCAFCNGSGCQECDGTGMHPQAAAARWQGYRLPELLALSVDEASRLFAGEGTTSSSRRLHSEISRRLEALATVDLGYINLDRSSPTLSRGESQRVRLAVALTSRLEDLLHVLDEPTVGQHPADVARLLPVFRQLGGPVIFVEHDRLAASSADWAIDIGPGAGEAGGQVVFQGTPSDLWQAETSTGRWFSLRARTPEFPPVPTPKNFFIVRNAFLRNLKGVEVAIPLERLTVVSGVSGSGKSTFVEDVLVASLQSGSAVGCEAIEGVWLKPSIVDQSPIGLNPRSNPATYTGLANIIRDLFSSVTGLSPSHFSFNRPEGACPTCKGMGAQEIQMRYLPSSWIPCEDCESQRFSEEVLAQKVAFEQRELSIADFFNLSVAEAWQLLKGDPRLSVRNQKQSQRILQALIDIGLGYLPLGQPSPTLSGGEAQRVKLARSLGKRSLRGELLVLDEPSTGLHPQDVAGLLVVLHRLARSGATLVVVEHNTDIVRAADWVVDLGPGSGPMGGEVLYSGSPSGLSVCDRSLTAKALKEEDLLQPARLPTQSTPSANVIEVIRARAHNLQDVSVSFPKGALTIVTGVSGSGKSSLVGDVLEAEARRRYLESLSLYERQSTREGPEAPVDSVTGLGVAVTITSERRMFQRRASVGTATELAHHLAVLLADLGERTCLECGSAMQRGAQWTCISCGSTAPIAEPRHFNPSVYAAACFKCNGVGTLQHPVPEKLIIHPQKPLCAGAMYSPGFFPQGYLGKPFNGGYYLVQALANRYGFDQFKTPWNEMSDDARKAFLFGDPEPMTVHYMSRKGQERVYKQKFPGFYGWVGDWDVGGTYSEARACPVCSGGGLRPEYANVKLVGHNQHNLVQMSLAELASVLDRVVENADAERLQNSRHFAATCLETAVRRVRFLCQVGLGYIHLNRATSTLSAGEAQRVRLAGLLGSQLTSLTVLLDEPSRGMHSSEVGALLGALKELSRAGNTVIVVEHDLLMIRNADYLVDMGPGAGVSGGWIVAQGTPEQVLEQESVTARWLRGEADWISGLSASGLYPKTKPKKWMIVRGARANNLKGEDVYIPLHRLTGVCGVSGSGKSTLVIDTLGRVLAPVKQTTSVAYEPVQPGEHDAIEGASKRVIILDQSRRGVSNPADFLDLSRPIQRIYAESEAAVSQGLSEAHFSRCCSGCGGSGVLRTDMGFLPDLFAPCDLCAGTGFLPEAWDVRLNGLTLPEVYSLTLEEVSGLFSDDERISRPLTAAMDVGLGYLVMRQPGISLSGGEVQRLKIARELSRKMSPNSLYILDEPTIGQHAEDVARLIGVLQRLVQEGQTVLVVEHHPMLLACCDWLVELGPGGGPHGGKIIACGPPELVAEQNTPTAPYLRELLGAGA